MKPVVIKYKIGGKTKTIKADACTGEVPAGSRTFYWIFYLGRKPKVRGLRICGPRKQVARVAEDRLLPGYKKKVRFLYGRPWIKRMRDFAKITLEPVETESFDYPIMYGIVGIPEDEAYVYQSASGVATLHVLNNPQVVSNKGSSFYNNLKALFPKQRVSILRPVTSYQEINIY